MPQHHHHAKAKTNHHRHAKTSRKRGLQRNASKRANDHVTESVKASDEALNEFHRDPKCDEQRRHRANCDCRGDARLPIQELH
jgi:predicted metal-dependent hydrolase